MKVNKYYTNEVLNMDDTDVKELMALKTDRCLSNYCIDSQREVQVLASVDFITEKNM